MNDNYYFIDGSSLLGDISRLWKRKKEFGNQKLDIDRFYRYFTGPDYRHLTSGGYRRFTIYFVTGERRSDTLTILPSFKSPNNIEDFHIRYTGRKIPRSQRVEDWLDLKKPPLYVMDRFNKSEKGVDTQICCDALQLAASSKLDRLFLYTNDSDFIPLIDTLKSMGSNVSLISLFNEGTNVELIKNSDSYSVPSSTKLRNLFGLET